MHPATGLARIGREGPGCASTAGNWIMVLRKSQRKRPLKDTEPAPGASERRDPLDLEHIGNAPMLDLDEPDVSEIMDPPGSEPEAGPLLLKSEIPTGEE